MIVLNKHVEALEDVIAKIESKIEALEAKKQAIIDVAVENGHEPTSKQEKRMEAIDETIDELNEEADNVQNAIDYLRRYTDN